MTTAIKFRKWTATVGDTAHVFYGTDADAPQIEAKIAALVKPNGPAVRLGNGDSIHVIDEVLCRPGRRGSEQFVWDRSGNRVKHLRVEYRTTGGVKSRKVLRHVFKSLD